MNITRRNILKTFCSGVAVSAVGGINVIAYSSAKKSEFDYILEIKEASFPLLDHKKVEGLGFNGSYPAPVLFATQDKVFRVKVINRLNEATTIHWHGIRLKNSMDGVPFLTQKPIMPKEEFIYEFTPKDAGSFWYHPHINSINQLSKGLCGTLIVQEKKPLPFQKDIILQLKNFSVTSNGILKKLYSHRNAARAGTTGSLFTVNGKAHETIKARAGEVLRLRLLNIDNTSVYSLLPCKSLNLSLLAIDSNPLSQLEAVTEPLELGAGARMDFAALVPAVSKSQAIKLEISRKGKVYSVLEVLVEKSPLAANKSSSLNSAKNKLFVLPPNPVSEPDLKKAKTFKFSFEWSGAMTPLGKGKQAKPAFWAINRISWKGMMEGKKPSPLAVLKYGESYILEFKNETPHQHPIHLHGLFFKVIESDKKKVRPYFADTVLMDKNEKVKVALVADNLGDWMFHCHIIEHLKTGFMGYISVVK